MEFEAYAYRMSRTVDFTLDDVHFTRCTLDNGRHINPLHSLGHLDSLPLELFFGIFLTLDIPSLTTLRRVNSRAMHLVDSLPEYKTMVKHWLNVLKAIISIDARYFDCITLYKTLFTRKCEACSRRGRYLYLITCKRVCYFCKAKPEYCPVLATSAAKYLGLGRKDIKHLPHILNLRGTYNTLCKLLAGYRMVLYDRQAVLHSALKTSTVASIRQRDMATIELLRRMSSIYVAFFDSSDLSVDRDFNWTGCRRVVGVENIWNSRTVNEFNVVDDIRGRGAKTVVDGDQRTDMYDRNYTQFLTMSA